MVAPLRCADCAAGRSQGGGSPPCPGGLRGVGSPLLWGLGQHPGKKKKKLDPILGWANLPMVFDPWFWAQWFSVHGIGCFGMYKYVL